MKISLLLLVTFFSTFAAPIYSKEVNVYSYRKPHLIKPMFDVFTERTGIKVNSIFIGKGMLERMKSEDRNSPADLIFTVDIGKLTDFKKAGLMQPVESKSLMSDIPANYRDPENYWFGLTGRARVFVVSKTRVVNAPKSYEELADPKWQGRVCTRQGKHPYMTALLASIIVANGYENTQSWLEGVKRNLARKPQGNDRAQVKAIYSGVCDVAVINSYYIFRMLNDEKQKEWAKSVNVSFPNQNGRGTHMNISGVGLAKHAPNKENAIRLMEFLASVKGQYLYAEKNGEYPLKPDIKPNDLVRSWGSFKRDKLGLAEIALKRTEAVRLVDKTGYND